MYKSVCIRSILSQPLDEPQRINLQVIAFPSTHYQPIDAVVRHAFDAARRQIKELTEQQRNRVKTQDMPETTNLATNLFPKQG